MITYPLQSPEEDPLLKGFLAAVANTKLRHIGIVSTPDGPAIHVMPEIKNPLPALQKALFEASRTKELEPLRSLTRYALQLPIRVVEQMVQPYLDIVSKMEERLRNDLEIRCLYGNQPQMGVVAAPITREVYATYRFIRYEKPRHIAFFLLNNASSKTIEEAVAQYCDPRDDSAYCIIPVTSTTIKHAMEKSVLPFFAYHLLAPNMVLPRPHIPIG